MDVKLLEVREVTDPGYKPVFDYETWRVAILNYLDEIHPERIVSMERHNETDEVFVLLKGKGILFFGDGGDRIGSVRFQVMQPRKIYNIKRSVWHTIVLSRSGSVLIVENQSTNRENSDYGPLDPGQRDLILKLSQREISDYR